LRLSLKAHPLALLRRSFDRLGIVPAARLRQRQDGRISVAGLVLVRQRPGSAKGVLFLTLEDESGVANIVVWPKLFEQFRQIVLTAGLLRVDGRIQRQGEVIHVVAEQISDLSPALRGLSGAGDITVSSRDFH
jgi:error-prone DNA polymerase